MGLDLVSFIYGGAVVAVVYTIIVMANRPKIEPPVIIEVERKLRRGARGRFISSKANP